MLDVFGIQQGGSQYRRLIAAFQRVFGATIFFRHGHPARESHSDASSSIQFHARGAIWYSRDPNQEVLPGGFENEIVLSDEFFREIRLIHSDGPRSGQSALLFARGLGSVYVGFLPMLHCQRARARTNLRRFRFGGSAREHGLCTATQVPRAIGTLAGFGASAVAELSSQDHREWRLHIDSSGCGSRGEGSMMASALLAPDLFSRRRISLAEIDSVVSARLGPTRRLGNSQPACFNRTSHHVSGQACGPLDRCDHWPFLR